MRLYLLLLVSLALSAQTATLSLTGPTSARPGATLNVVVSLGGAAQAALQWTLALPPGFAATGTAGPKAAEAAKQLDCAGDLCLVYGMNANAIGAGAVAGYAVTVPASQAPGVVTLALGETVAASPRAEEVPSAAGPALSLAILARTDIDGDGETGDADIALMRAMAKKAAPCTADQNGDGRCNVIDLLLVILAAYGL